MNRSLLLRVTATLIAGGALMFGQAPAEGGTMAEGQAMEAPVSTTPVAPQPTPQSEEEMTALQGIMDPTITADARIDAVDQFVADYPDSEFKGTMLQVAAMMAQQLNDYDRLMVYGERTLEADPDNFDVMIMMATALAQRTREFDLDKEEKLSRATELANQSLTILETAPRPRADVTDAQWDGAKNEYRAEAHGALGFAAMAREETEQAIEEFRTAVNLSQAPNPNVQLMLARELSEVGNHGEAINVLDTMLADPQASPQVRQLAEQQRQYALQEQEKQ